MEEDLLALLMADDGVSAIAGDRVSWGYRPQSSELPAIVLHLVSEVPSYVLSGDTGQRQSRVQVDCMAFGYLEARNLSRAVTTALSGFSGVAGSTVFQGIFQDSARDLSESGGADQQVFLLSMDFLARHLSQE